MTNKATDKTAGPLILAAETSGRLGSVALGQGPKLLAEEQFSEPMKHSAELFPAANRLLSNFSRKANEIEQVYVSIGPGSFTGLRIAVTLAKTFALANGTRIVAIDTLDLIAANVDSDEMHHAQNGPIATILDAKRGQFFIAVYEKTRDTRPQTSDLVWRKILPDCLMTAEEFLERFAEPARPIWLLGEGLVYYREKFNHPGVRFLDQRYWAPCASKLHLLGWRLARQGQFTDPLALTPTYPREPDVKV